MKRVLKRIAITLGACIAAFLLYVQLTFKVEFEAPLTNIKSTTDSVTIARGKYLVMGPAHCWECHTAAPAGARKLSADHMNAPMTGGVAFDLPVATLYTANLTPDAETGIGRFSDEELARAIRYGVNHENHAMVPFMEFQTVSDQDLTAIISYLRSTKPARNEVPGHRYNMLGKILSRFMLRPNLSPKVINNPVADTTAEYGKYLVTALANCRACHTSRDKVTGKFTSAPFSGGYVMETEQGTFVTPNLTPDSTTGRIHKWSTAQFVKRFQTGEAIPGSPMPWAAYQEISEKDLQAIHKFLLTLEPAQNKIDNTFIPKTEE